MRVGPERSTSSSSVLTRSAVPPAAASASPGHPVEQLAPLAPWPEPKLQAKSARKRSESGDNGSSSSKEASLAIRRDRETFSLRHCAVSHKAREIHVIALWATLLRQLSPAIRCMHWAPLFGTRAILSRNNERALRPYRRAAGIRAKNSERRRRLGLATLRARQPA